MKLKSESTLNNMDMLAMMLIWNPRSAIEEGKKMTYLDSNKEQSTHHQYQLADPTASVQSKQQKRHTH